MKRRLHLIALDLDGTALRPDGTLSEYTRNILEKAHEAGIHIVAASGRAFASLPEEVTSLPFMEYAIASNGANVYEVKNRRRVLSHCLEAKAVQQILEVARENGVMVEGFIDGVPYSQREYVENPMQFGAREWSVAYVRRTRSPVEDIFAFLLEHQACLDSLDLIVGDMEQKKRLRQELLQRVEGVYLTSSVETLLELSDEKAGKAPALRFLSELLGVRQEETAAFGNAENDVDMMRWAGIGVAVANAPKEIQEAADEVAKTNDEDGVADWLERYLQSLPS